MRILVGWDNAEQLETIDSFLNIGDNSAVVCADGAAMEAAMRKEKFHVVLLALNFPTADECYPLFRRLREVQLDTPIVGAWFPGEVHLLAKFMAAGLHSYILRDAGEEFILLLTTALEAAHQSVLARHAQLLSEKLREEVASVRQLQESVIPNDLPSIAGYRLVGRYEPSQINVIGDRPVVMAGGDYYDAFRMGEDTLCMILGDAAGHGVKACMSIMTMHTLMGMTRNQTYWDTAEFVNEINRRLCKSTIVAGESGGFITLLYCSLDLKQNRLQWTSAGHPLPLIQNMDTNEIVQMATADHAGLPLVVSEDWTYTSVQSPIPPRSRVLLYTDGLEEAFPNDNERHRQFGLTGIIETMKTTTHLPIEGVLEELFAASNRATEGAGRMDDTSVVILERRE